jgi:hypothetical protein
MFNGIVYSIGCTLIILFFIGIVVCCVLLVV